MATELSALPPGIKEKLRRAELHRRDFDRRVNRFLETQSYQIVREDDTKTGKTSWRVKVLNSPPLVRWGGLAGEILYDLRSALDQLANALAIAHTGDTLP